MSQDDKFLEWLKYGSQVVPYFEHQIIREFKISKNILDKWLAGRNHPKQQVKEAVIEWMSEGGYKKK